MNRNINAYKFRRLFKKKVCRLQNSIDSIFFSTAKKRDFSWRGARVNRYVNRHRSIDFGLGIKILVFVCIALATSGLLLYHPSFGVRSIKTSGLVRISESEILENSLAGTQGYRFFIIPRANYFFFNTDELVSILTEKFPIEHILIQKQFPNGLSITIEEKISNIIFDNGMQYAYIDLEGNAVEIKRNVLDHEWKSDSAGVTSTNPANQEVMESDTPKKIHKPDLVAVHKEFGNLPILYDRRGDEILINKKMVDSASAKGVMDWYSRLSKKGVITIAYFELADSTEDITIHTQDGWEIRARISGVEAQANALETIVKEKITLSGMEYIDVRYEGRAYWK